MKVGISTPHSSNIHKPIVLKIKFNKHVPVDTTLPHVPNSVKIGLRAWAGEYPVTTLVLPFVSFNSSRTVLASIVSIGPIDCDV